MQMPLGSSRGLVSSSSQYLWHLSYRWNVRSSSKYNNLALWNNTWITEQGLTEPPSVRLVSMAMTQQLCSQIICQKSLTVLSRGPTYVRWKHILLTTADTRTFFMIVFQICRCIAASNIHSYPIMSLYSMPAQQQQIYIATTRPVNLHTLCGNVCFLFPVALHETTHLKA